MERNIRIEQQLPYRPEHVWRAITEREALGAWLMESDFAPVLGRPFTFRMKPQRGWDGLTHCEVIEIEPMRSLAFTYRGEATGEKTLSCAGVTSEAAKAAAKGIFTELDTVLRLSIEPDRPGGGTEGTRLRLDHTGFKGFKLVVVSLVMGNGWRRMLRTRLPAVLEAIAQNRELPRRAT